VETVDGRTFSLGDDTLDYSLQACSQPLAYCLAVEELGSAAVQKYMSFEPSGTRFNAFTLTEENKPFNPFVNSGAIVTCSLLLQDHDIAEVFSKIQEYVRGMAGGVKVGFNNSIFLSERSTADRNRAIAYWLVSQLLFGYCTVTMSLKVS
jgi:glutaminase